MEPAHSSWSCFTLRTCAVSSARLCLRQTRADERSARDSASDTRADLFAASTASALSASSSRSGRGARGAREDTLHASRSPADKRPAVIVIAMHSNHGRRNVVAVARRTSRPKRGLATPMSLGHGPGRGGTQSFVNATARRRRSFCAGCVAAERHATDSDGLPHCSAKSWKLY